MFKHVAISESEPNRPAIACNILKYSCNTSHGSLGDADK